MHLLYPFFLSFSNSLSLYISPTRVENSVLSAATAPVCRRRQVQRKTDTWETMALELFFREAEADTHAATSGLTVLSACFRRSTVKIFSTPCCETRSLYTCSVDVASCTAVFTAPADSSVACVVDENITMRIFFRPPTSSLTSSDYSFKNSGFICMSVDHIFINMKGSCMNRVQANTLM